MSARDQPRRDPRAFDAAFGTGAGERVRIACKRDGNRQIITELTIGLTGVVNGPATVGDLILAAAPTDGWLPRRHRRS